MTQTSTSEEVERVGDLDLGPAELLAMYRIMQTITEMGTQAAAEVRAGRLESAFYPVRGMEGVCAALGIAMQPTDEIVSTYRNLGDAIAKGASLRGIASELYGRANGLSKGKGGAMHLHDQVVGFVTSTGVVGSGLPIAVGLALAAQLSGHAKAVVVTFGDGATSIGAFHEAMNIAGLWKVPAVFVCQNNRWGEHTALADYAASTDLAARAEAYAMPTVKVDGFDPIATAHVLAAALATARAGRGPTFVECVTYRLTGHVSTADYSYMPTEELAAATARDPAPTFRKWLTEHDVTAAELDEIDRQIAADVADAFEFARQSPLPEASERYADVFAEESMVQGQ